MIRKRKIPLYCATVAPSFESIWQFEKLQKKRRRKNVYGADCTVVLQYSVVNSCWQIHVVGRFHNVSQANFTWRWYFRKLNMFHNINDNDWIDAVHNEQSSEYCRMRLTAWKLPLGRQSMGPLYGHSFRIGQYDHLISRLIKHLDSTYIYRSTRQDVICQFEKLQKEEEWKYARCWSHRRSHL